MRTMMNNYLFHKSQEEAIKDAKTYFLTTTDQEPIFLINAVMRWGKCFTSLGFINKFNEEAPKNNKKEIKNILILTFFPDTYDSWYSLFPGQTEEQEQFKNFNFVSTKVKGSKPVSGKINVYFDSFQQIYNGRKDKNSIFYNQNFELLILDEYHYGAYNPRATKQFSQYYSEDLDKNDVKAEEELRKTLTVQYKLVLSGTPYKITGDNSSFTFKNSYTFNYFQEQEEKLINHNPDYQNNPTLKLYSVNISGLTVTRNGMIEDRISGLYDKINFLFKDNLFESLFKLPNGASFWLIGKVSDGQKIEDYINRTYPDKYNIINLNKTNKETLKYLRDNLDNSPNKHSIVLSYNKLTLGITESRIENVVFLRDISTPELYMQAGSRAKSQYSKALMNLYGKKDFAYLISFNINNDKFIFQSITNKKEISEEKFLKLLPVSAVEYDALTNTSEIIDLTSKEEFLNEVSKLSTNEAVERVINRNHIRSANDIPDELKERLANFAAGTIGYFRKSSDGNRLINNNLLKEKGLEERKINPLKKAKYDGRIDGRNARQIGREMVIKTYSDIEDYQKAYADSYKKAFEKYTEEEIPEEALEEVKDYQYIAEVIVKRLVYALVSDYFKEREFIDINNAPDSFFTSMIGLDRETVMMIYNSALVNQSVADDLASTFTAKENRNTSYLGLNNPNDYAFIDLDELTTEKIQQKQNEKIEILVDGFKDIVDFNQIIENELDNKNYLVKSGKKYIYIARPSEFLKNMIYFFEIVKGLFPETSEFKAKVIEYISYFSELAIGVKIGETHRDPSIRVDELNGYTDKHLLFEIDSFFEITENKSDTEFHSLLVKKGYERIKAGTRKERFNITPEQAKKELNSYIKDKKEIDYSKLSPEELIELLKQRDKELN
jgi:hypothetical protein